MLWMVGRKNKGDVVGTSPSARRLASGYVHFSMMQPERGRFIQIREIKDDCFLPHGSCPVWVRLVHLKICVTPFKISQLGTWL